MTVEELADYGMRRMDDEGIRGFLSSQSVGVLALPTDEGPTMRPMSFGFDGEETLYLLYVGAPGSRKAALSDRAGAASFLVYSAETMFNWRSVLLKGRIDALSPEAAERVRDTVDIPWRPELFERASSDARTTIYGFAVDEWSGIEHVGLPPAFRGPAADEG